jgi:hypothetical protein
MPQVCIYNIYIYEYSCIIYYTFDIYNMYNIQYIFTYIMYSCIYINRSSVSVSRGLESSAGYSESSEDSLDGSEGSIESSEGSHNDYMNPRGRTLAVVKDTLEEISTYGVLLESLKVRINNIYIYKYSCIMCNVFIYIHIHDKYIYIYIFMAF